MKKANLSALTGFICCFLMVIVGISTNGGIRTILNFIHIPSLIVTGGGAIFAVMITSDSFSDFKDGLKSFLTAFQQCKYSIDDVAADIFNLSGIARKEGLLALEEQSENLSHDFLRDGIRMVVDGSDRELVKDILETKMIHIDDENQKRIGFWEDFGAYAPAWGMLGTLLGLINMMRSMGSDPGAVGSGMSLALITTLYGSLIANWVCIPIAKKLKKSYLRETEIMELSIEGVLSIQAGENPQIIKEKIHTFREQWEESHAA